MIIPSAGFHEKITVANLCDRKKALNLAIQIQDDMVLGQMFSGKKKHPRPSDSERTNLI
jgi:hypothetical protein